MNNLSDQLAAEIRKMQQGNFNDYETFYNMTAVFIGRMINDVIKDQTQSYQIMTEVYNTIYSRIGELEDLEQFYKWVGSITTNILAARTVAQLPENAPARENIHVAQYANEDGELIIPDKLMPDQRFRSMVQNMMEQFPLTHKLVMQYYYYEGKSVEEIATCLYKDVTWVTKIIADIKAQLTYIVNQFPEYQENPKKSLAQMPVFWIIFAASVQIPVGIIAVASTAAAAGAAGVIAGTAVGGAAGSAVAGSGAASGIAGVVGAVSGEGASGIAGAVSGISGGAATGAAGGISGATATAATGAVGGISGSTATAATGAAGGISGATATAASGAAGGVSGAAVTGTVASGVASTGAAAASTGIFATVGAKVAVGVVVAALVAGGGAAAYYVTTKDKDDDTETKTTEEAQVAADDTEAVTEATTEEQEEEVEYAGLYLDVLEEYESQINAYNQYRGDMAAGSEESFSYADSAPVAIADITGDDVPELIFIYSAEDYINSLAIYTANDDHAVLIYEEAYWDVQAGGGSRYFLFKKEDDDHLYARNGNSDEFVEENYYRFDVGDDGNLEKVELLTSYEEPNYDYSDIIGTYTENGKDIDEETFYDKRDDLLRDASELLLYNSRMSNEYGIYDYMYNAEQKYMTYDEAVAYLGQFADEGEAPEVSDRENALPLTDTEGFYLYSGAGAWSTDMEINPDGTFSGSYHDSDLGVSGDGYDSTVYISNFSGKFKNIQKVNDYIYSMELDYVETENKVGEEWFETGDDRTIRYVASEPYGIYQGTTFYLYLSGVSTNELPEGFVNWIDFSYNMIENDTLTRDGLYNEDQDLSFTGE